jgi:hypothetical protein
VKKSQTIAVENFERKTSKIIIQQQVNKAIMKITNVALDSIHDIHRQIENAE